MSRDWSKAFWDCSFKGFPFYVEVDEFEFGRRVSVGDIAYGEAPITEDFGQIANRYRVTAYAASATADLEGVAFAAILRTPGPGPLILPFGPAGLYHAPNGLRVREKDRAGYVAFDVEFVTAGLSSVPFAAGAIVPRLSALSAVGRTVLGSIF